MKSIIPMKIKCSAALLSLLVTGCVSPPATRISGTVDGVPFSITSPKQVDMAGFHLRADKSNGTFDLAIDRLGSTNSADVIQTTGAAQVAQIKALGDALSQAVSTAGQAFASGGTAIALRDAVKSASPAPAPSVNATSK
jgi:hypothetical protein